MYKDITEINVDSLDVDAIKQSIRNILLTRKGSVPGKPEFGSDLYNILFNQIDHLVISVAKNYIFEALNKFEDRITIQEILVKPVEEFNKIIIDINFKYRDSNLTITDTNVDVVFNV